MFSVRRPLLRGPVVILAGGLIFAAFGALGTTYGIWSSRDAILKQWQSRLTAQTHILTAHAVQTIDTADILLRGTLDNLQSHQLAYEPDFRATVSTYRIFQMLRGAMNGVPQVVGMSIIGNDGKILNLTRQYPPPQINLAEQDYFRAFEDRPDLDLFISAASINSLTGESYFYLARPIKSPSGERLGLIVAGIASGFFSNFYQSAILGDLKISLARRDGEILSRNFNLAEFPGLPNLETKTLHGRRNMPESGIRYSGAQETSQSFENLVAFEHSDFLPIHVNVSISYAQIFKDWMIQAQKFSLIGGTLSALLIILTLLLSRLVRTLERTRNAALAATEAKTRFVTNISHELRTPMNAIMGGTHHLMHTNLPPESQRYGQIISASAQQLTVLINDILDFSYFDAREFRIETAPFKPRLMAQIIMDMARALAPNTKLSLICKVDENVPDIIIGDSNRIKQIALNLLSNAIKYTSEGVVELRLSYLRTSNNLLVLQVIDNGPGIAKEDQQRIFEPFERTERARQHPGTGLGLTICKKLAEAMSGSIKIYSKLGNGTYVTVEIPASEARPHETISLPIGPSPAPDFQKSLRVLIAEDVAPSRVLLTMMLENLGHQVIAVENGLEALQAANQQSFDLILMDLQMPDMDGMTATQQIRAGKGPNCKTQILAVSANADVNGPEGLAAAGFDDALLKPVKAERLGFVLASIAAQIL